MKHIKKSTLSCYILEKDFPNKEILKVHITQHTQKKTFTKPLCELVFYCIGTSMNRVYYGTKGTNTLVPNNMSTQTWQIHQSEVGANTNIPYNNYTQTSRPSMN